MLEELSSGGATITQRERGRGDRAQQHYGTLIDTAHDAILTRLEAIS